MRKLLPILLSILAVLLGSAGEGFALPACPTDPKERYHNCYGTYVWENGDKYIGEWQYNSQNGRGTYSSPDGIKYVGEWKNSDYNGQGTITYPTGDKYVGKFKDNKYHGQGTATHASGKKYVGEFRDNKRNGYGTKFDADGTVQKQGYWKNNELIHSTKEDKQEIPQAEGSQEYETLTYIDKHEQFGPKEKAKWIQIGIIHYKEYEQRKEDFYCYNDVIKKQYSFPCEEPEHIQVYNENTPVGSQNSPNAEQPIRDSRRHALPIPGVTKTKAINKVYGRNDIFIYNGQKSKFQKWNRGLSDSFISLPTNEIGFQNLNDFQFSKLPKDIFNNFIFTNLSAEGKIELNENKKSFVIDLNKKEEVGEFVKYEIDKNRAVEIVKIGYVGAIKYFTKDRLYIWVSDLEWRQSMFHSILRIGSNIFLRLNDLAGYGTGFLVLRTKGYILADEPQKILDATIDEYVAWAGEGCYDSEEEAKAVSQTISSISVKQFNGRYYGETKVNPTVSFSLDDSEAGINAHEKFGRYITNKESIFLHDNFLRHQWAICTVFTPLRRSLGEFKNNVKCFDKIFHAASDAANEKWLSRSFSEKDISKWIMHLRMNYTDKYPECKSIPRQAK